MVDGVQFKYTGLRNMRFECVRVVSIAMVVSIVCVGLEGGRCCEYYEHTECHWEIDLRTNSSWFSMMLVYCI